MTEQAQILADQTPDTQRRWVLKIFQKITAIFGTGFTSQLSPDQHEKMLNSWISGLGAVDADSIKLALVVVQNADDAPTMAEFKALCKASNHTLSTDHISQKLPAFESISDPSPAPPNPKNWAYQVIRGYEAGTYKIAVGYALACQAVGHTPQKTSISIIEI